MELFDFFPSGIVVVRGEEPYEVLQVNEVMMQCLGVQEEEVQEVQEGEVPFLSLVKAQDQKNAGKALSEAKEKTSSKEYEVRMKEKEQGYRWYSLQARFVADDAAIVLFLTDIQKRKLQEEKLRTQNERYKLLEKITGELAFEYDVESSRILIGETSFEIGGFTTRPEYYEKQRGLEKIFQKDDIIILKEEMKAALRQEKEGSLEIRMYVDIDFPEDGFDWYRLNFKSIPDKKGEIVTIIGRFININEEKKQNNQQEERTKRDSLTKLLNKQGLKKEAEEFLQEAENQNHAILMINIDNFKEISDYFGLLFGDTILIIIAEKIAGIFRKSDIIGRVGGDEFVVLMKNTRIETVLEKAEQLCYELRQTYQIQENEITISASVGIAFFDKKNKTYDQVYEKADFAMYQAKNAGKDQYRLAESEESMDELRKEWKIRQRKKNTETIRLHDDGFISSAFSLLANALDIDSSLKLLLERIGTRYELGAVAALEEGDEGEYQQISYWSKYAEEECSDIVGIQNWSTDGEFDERGLWYAEDCVNLLSQGEEQSLKRQIHAMVKCRFQCQDGKMGMLAFCDLEKKREWSEFEKEIFLEISRIISVFVSLTRKQRESENKIQELRNMDPLTGLYNETTFRRLAQEKINHMEPGMEYAIVFTDIKEFSYVNENFGFEAGNLILCEYAETIASPSKVISSRFHSDLIISLVWDNDRETIKSVVQKKVTEFTKKQHGAYPQGNLSMVAGIYFIEKEGEDIDIAIENANLTRKKMKQNGTEQVCQVYNSDMRTERETQKRIITEFEDTLKEERFLVYIQPKFILQSMTMSGGEALVRWQRRDGTMEYPNDFIPVLERCGYIKQLDFYVLEQVLKYLRKWKDEGKELHRISVNFSRKHFENEGFYERICALTQKYDIDPKYIEVEITESLWISGINAVKREMQHLRTAGFAVAIDDFGTGYSSLSMLHDMPADIVKIDKSFLDRTDIKKEKEFIEKIGALIHSVKDEVIFEGIETQQQLKFLIDCGFNYGQGYLYDRPLPIEVFEEKYMK